MICKNLASSPKDDVVDPPVAALESDSLVTEDTDDDLLSGEGRGVRLVLLLLEPSASRGDDGLPKKVELRCVENIPDDESCIDVFAL